MSWFIRAFSIAAPDPEAYYTAVDPVEFLEWQFNQLVPKGAVFTKKLPGSHQITEGKIIASMRLTSSNLKKKNWGYELKQDEPGQIVLTAGQVTSPQETLINYSAQEENFKRGLERFKSSCISRQYVASVDDEPHLYKIQSFNDSSAEIINFGKVEKVVQKLQETGQHLKTLALQKKGRAFETTKARKFECAMMFVQDGKLPVDAPKMDFIINEAGLKPIQVRTIPWKQCYVELSPDAKFLKDRLDAFYSMKWVKSSISYMNSVH